MRRKASKQVFSTKTQARSTLLSEQALGLAGPVLLRSLQRLRNVDVLSTLQEMCDANALLADREEQLLVQMQRMQEQAQAAVQAQTELAQAQAEDVPSTEPVTARGGEDAGSVDVGASAGDMDVGADVGVGAVVSAGADADVVTGAGAGADVSLLKDFAPDADALDRRARVGRVDGRDGRADAGVDGDAILSTVGTISAGTGIDTGIEMAKPDAEAEIKAEGAGAEAEGIEGIEGIEEDGEGC
ncbi:hypothetical protein B484DRAFT_405154, partial [Ochromonadaceae sp. CCMP2298]